jgi:hypothetical protein
MTVVLTTKKKKRAYKKFSGSEVQVWGMKLQNVATNQSLIINLSKGKAIPLQAWAGPEGSRSLRLPDFKPTTQEGGKVCQPYAPAAFTPMKYSWYSFLLEAESTPGPKCGRKDYVKDKFQ